MLPPASAATQPAAMTTALPAFVRLQGDPVGARKGFENAIRMRCNGRASIAAQLALANLHFNQQNYAESQRM